MRTRAVFAGFLVVVLMAAAAVIVRAEQGVVVTRDGARYEGDVRETEREVIVTIRGIETVIPRRDVVSVTFLADYEIEFRERLAGLEPADVASRIRLAREAFDQRRYDLAREVLAEALRIDPNSREATDMLDLVDRQMRLERSGPPGEPATPPPGPPPAATGPSAPEAADVAPQPARPGTAATGSARHLLSPEQINLVRQRELKSSDGGVLVRIPADVKRAFAERQNLTFAEFNRLSPVQQAIQIIDRGDETMWRQVRITSDPPSIVEYKRDIQPLVLGNCATSACHGGPAGGSFRLYTPADSDAVSYTNFYILTQYPGRAGEEDAEGIFGSAVRKLIERGRGDVSLLANYGLPTAVAEYDHPEVGGRPIQPVFRNTQDARYQRLVNWMNNSLVRIEPKYDLDVPLPGGSPDPAESVEPPEDGGAAPAAADPSTLPADPAAGTGDAEL